MWRRNKTTQDREESRSFSMMRFQNVRKIYAEIAEVQKNSCSVSWLVEVGDLVDFV